MPTEYNDTGYGYVIKTFSDEEIAQNKTKKFTDDNIVHIMRDAMIDVLQGTLYSRTVRQIYADYKTLTSEYLEKVALPKEQSFYTGKPEWITFEDFLFKQDLNIHKNDMGQFTDYLNKSLGIEMPMPDVILTPRFCIDIVRHLLGDRYIPSPDQQQTTDGSGQQNTSHSADSAGQYGHTITEPPLRDQGAQSSLPSEQTPRQFGDTNMATQQNSGGFSTKHNPKGLPGPAAQRNSSGGGMSRGQGQVEG